MSRPPLPAEHRAHRALARPLPGQNPVLAGAYDLAELGYTEQEFLLQGSATSYRLDGDRSPDGQWTARPDETAPFTTRLLVRRPASEAAFSGTVIVEWLNVSGGLDAAPDWMLTHTHLIRRGHAWVGVSAQRAGIEGGGMVDGPHLKKAFPSRYAVLDHPGDAWSFDIFSQAGRVLLTGQAAAAGTGPAAVARTGQVGAAATGGAPLGPLRPDRLLATGHSQSAAFLVTYVNAVDWLAVVYDGFHVHGRTAEGAAIDSGFAPARSRDETAPRPVRTGERIRADVRVPVLVLQTETDVAALGSGRAEQADGDLIRLWELAGAAHADTYLLAASHYDNGRLPPGRLADLLKPTSRTILGRTDCPINSGPQQHYVACAAIEHLGAWAAGGSPAPTAARLDGTPDGRDFHRDYYGIATGGIRTPWTDVPTATLSGLGQSGGLFAFLLGTTVPIGPDELSRRYPGGPADYLARFTSALDATIAEGFLLADDRAEILALAGTAFG